LAATNKDTNFRRVFCHISYTTSTFEIVLFDERKANMGSYPEYIQFDEVKTLEAKGQLMECDRKECVGLAFRIGPFSGM
jgi:hypothetical protein